MRLTAAPGSDQTIRIKLQSDGQTLATDACGCDSRYDAASGTVTFDSTNWFLPFTVRLTSNPAAPATDPFQPLETFPAPSADRVFETKSDPHDFDLVGGIRFDDGWFDGRGWLGGPVWLDGHGWYDGAGNSFDGHGWFDGHDGWWFDGDNWFDGHAPGSGAPARRSTTCSATTARPITGTTATGTAGTEAGTPASAARGPARAAADHPPEGAGSRAAARVQVRQRRPRDRGDEPGRRYGHVRPGDRPRRGRPGDDQLLAELGHGLPDRDDDGGRDRDRPGRNYEHSVVHREGARHHRARDHVREPEPDRRGDEPGRRGG